MTATSNKAQIMSERTSGEGPGQNEHRTKTTTDQKSISTLKSDADLAFFYTISDSDKYNDEKLTVLEKPIFDAAERAIDRLDVKETVIFDLLYSEKLCRP